MKLTWSLPPKSPLRSKAVWTSIAGVALGMYEAAADQYNWPKVPGWSYVILASLGVYSLRAARRPIEWGGGGSQPAGAPSVAIQAPAQPQVTVTPQGVTVGIPTPVTPLEDAWPDAANPLGRP